MGSRTGISHQTNCLQKTETPTYVWQQYAHPIRVAHAVHAMHAVNAIHAVERTGTDGHRHVLTFYAHLRSIPIKRAYKAVVRITNNS